MANKKQTKEKKEVITITVERSTWKKLSIQKLKYGYRDWDSFMKSISKILVNFKPELEDLKK